MILRVTNTKCLIPQIRNMIEPRRRGSSPRTPTRLPKPAPPLPLGAGSSYGMLRARNVFATHVQPKIDRLRKFSTTGFQLAGQSLEKTIHLSKTHSTKIVGTISSGVGGYLLTQLSTHIMVVILATLVVSAVVVVSLFQLNVRQENQQVVVEQNHTARFLCKQTTIMFYHTRWPLLVGIVIYFLFTATPPPVARGIGMSQDSQPISDLVTTPLRFIDFLPLSLTSSTAPPSATAPNLELLDDSDTFVHFSPDTMGGSGATNRHSAKYDVKDKHKKLKKKKKKKEKKRKKSLPPRYMPKYHTYDDDTAVE